MLRGGKVVLSFRDASRGVRFFVETLGMKLVSQNGDEAVIDAGDGFVLAVVQGEPRGGATRVGFGAKLPLDEAVAILENRGVVLRRTGDGAEFESPEGHAFFLYPATADHDT
jgi:catechol 2,3-dioxygenase-like lactoylglutathione lyase family enzyme